MVLAIDVGNSSTSFALFKAGRITKKWRVVTAELKDIRPMSGAEVIVSSVVPRADRILRKKYPRARFISGPRFEGIKIRIKDKAKIGADRVVNAYAAARLHGKPAIVVDFGTATTFDVISGKGEYLGGAIVPGIRMAADALHSGTAKLPGIKILPPRSVIGNSTVEAMRSGMVHGYASLVEGMIKRFRKAVKGRPVVIATGGYARLIKKYARGIDIIDGELTLKGLYLLWRKN